MAINLKAYLKGEESNIQEDVSEELKESIFNILVNDPLNFIENKGQLDSKVKYYVRGNGYAFYFTENEIKFSFIQKNSTEKDITSLAFNSPKEREANKEKEDFMMATMALEFIDVSKKVKIEPQNKLNYFVNYFQGNDPTKWNTKIQTYEKITYKEMWEGIDLVFYGDNGKLKYDFIVKPQASVEDIKFTYRGFDEKLIDENGNLVFKMPIGELIDEKPICYQEIDGEKVIIESDFTIQEEGNLTFYGYKLQDGYDKEQTIIIDPGIIYSSYLGGNNHDYGYAIAVDQSGNVYVTGITDSTDFPLVNAFQENIRGVEDAFITKIDTTPSIVYSTYLGGGGYTGGKGIAVDENENVYVTGYTDSIDFPILNAFQSNIGGSRDGFIIKIDKASDIVYSSYLGGSGEDYCSGIAVDKDGNAYVTGYTYSTDFPTMKAFQPKIAGDRDGFITKIDNIPSVVYSSYLGGANHDECNGVAVDQDGNAYVTGNTLSLDFPTVKAFQPKLGGSNDGFITKIDSFPAIVYSSYLGGSSGDYCNGIAVDQNGNAYVTGNTGSIDFPTVRAFQPKNAGYIDGFITKVDKVPSVVYSSYLGGRGWERSNAITVDRNSNVYVIGYTGSADFPTVKAFQSSRKSFDLFDVFIIKIDKVPSIVFSSYLGGGNADVGYGIAVDKKCNIYVTGADFIGEFPIVNAFQPNDGGVVDTFVTKIGLMLILEVNAANLTAMVLD